MRRKSERLTVEDSLHVDTDRLYGPLKNAITYLKEIADRNPDKDLELAEVWTGYEDMHMEFQFTRLETDQELNDRVAAERRKRREEAVAKGRAEKKKALDAEIKKLKRQRDRLA